MVVRRRMPEDDAMQRIRIEVRANWDDEARVWVATSDDVPGLITEADTVEELVKALKVMISELFELNGRPNSELPMHLTICRW